MAAAAMSEPRPPPMVKSGASVPPEVPLLSATAQETSLSRTSESRTVPASEPVRMSWMLS